MTKADAVIIYGIFADTPVEAHWLDWLEGRPFTTLFVDGNHENFEKLNALPVHIWHGGKVHYVRPHVIHLMRGQVFEIGGLTFFAMGGAASHDIQDGVLDPEARDFEERYWQMRRCRFDFWYAGHYHQSRVVDDRYIVQWKQMTELKQGSLRQQITGADNAQEKEGFTAPP